MPKRIVITGGPGTGKSSVINHLRDLGYYCLPEISREIIREAQENGHLNPFVENPLQFSNLLLHGRMEQHHYALHFSLSKLFYDRGIPDIAAYLDFARLRVPKIVETACANYRYDQVFLLSPWESIFTTDNERYENFEQAIEIHDNIKNTYNAFGYNLTEVPKATIAERAAFIIKNVL